jgi:hypothetical protein
MTTPTPVWRDRLADSIQHAFDACWPVPRKGGRKGYASFEFLSPEEEQRDAELRYVALADLVLPFAAAGILDERAPVGDLPAPETIRQYVDDNLLADRYMSVGCQIGRAGTIGDPVLHEEFEREWSTWLTYCMHAHSPELRKALPVLHEARDAIGGLLIAPKRRIERIGPDGERLASLVPRPSGDPEEAARVDALLDQCEVVAAHADSFRVLAPLFPHLVPALWTTHLHRYAEYDPDYLSVAYLWPFTLDSLNAVIEICDSIERLAQSLNVDEEDEDRETRAGAYVR